MAKRGSPIKSAERASVSAAAYDERKLTFDLQVVDSSDEGDASSAEETRPPPSKASVLNISILMAPLTR